MTRLALLAALALAVAQPLAPARAAAADWTDPVRQPPQVALVTIHAGPGPLTLRAAVAATEEARVRGMAGATPPGGWAVLYDFGAQRDVRMWTRDDSVPLDMIFVGEEGVVSYVRADAPPGSEAPISSRVPVRYVIEAAAGTAAAAGVSVGDAVDIGPAGAGADPDASRP